MSAEEFIAIPLAEFMFTSKLSSDIYIKLSDTKFVFVAKAGESVQIERLTNYQTKKVYYIYVKKDEYSAYVDQSINIAGILMKKSELSTAVKTSIVTHTASAVFREVNELKFAEETFSHAKAITSTILQFVEAKPELNKLLDVLKQGQPSLVNHSIGVSMLSCMMGIALGWVQKPTLEKLALGALLHDIGKRDIPKELWHKNKKDMTPAEFKVYETHCEAGVKILKEIPFVPEDSISIVMDHHELATGKGFPRNLKSLRIHPLARVVALANAFCEVTLPRENAVIKTPSEALAYLENSMGQSFDKDALKALHIIIERSNKKVA